MARANSVVSYTIREDGSGLDFVVAGVGKIEFTLAKVKDAGNNIRATLFGYGQRLVDKTAIPRDTTTGASATAQEKFDAILAMRDHYYKEDGWSLRASAGGSRQDDGLIVTAMCNVLTSGDIDKANFLVDKWATTHPTADGKPMGRRECLAAWAATEKVAAEMGRIRAMRAKGDADAMLAEMMKGDEE